MGADICSSDWGWQTKSPGGSISHRVGGDRALPCTTRGALLRLRFRAAWTCVMASIEWPLSLSSISSPSHRTPLVLFLSFVRLFVHSFTSSIVSFLFGIWFISVFGLSLWMVALVSTSYFPSPDPGPSPTHHHGLQSACLFRVNLPPFQLHQRLRIIPTCNLLRHFVQLSHCESFRLRSSFLPVKRAHIHSSLSTTRQCAGYSLPYHTCAVHPRSVERDGYPAPFDQIPSWGDNVRDRASVDTSPDPNDRGARVQARQRLPGTRRLGGRWTVGRNSNTPDNRAAGAGRRCGRCRLGNLAIAHTAVVIVGDDPSDKHGEPTTRLEPPRIKLPRERCGGRAGAWVEPARERRRKPRAPFATHTPTELGEPEFGEVR
eukprot:m.91168 g.91168  ORF g.91168 m.91168 type:complete len:374 (+) comp20170_c0_seq1:277-1398(+)